MKSKIAKRGRDLFPEIIRLLEAGEVIILPTDTTYALVAHAFNSEAVARIGQLKRWSTAQPLAIFTRKERADEIAVISPACRRLMEHFPYPVTIIVPKKENVPDTVTGGYDNLLLVCPDRFIYDLIAAVPFHLACTSASLSSELKATRLDTALYLFEDRVPLIVDGGKSQYARSGTMIDFTVELPTILKYGPVSVDDLRPIIPEIVLPSHLMK